MRVAICDDELLAARQLERIVKKILERETGGVGAASGEAGKGHCERDEVLREAGKEPQTDDETSEDSRVRIFTSGAALLREIENFDIVFLDLRMPQMDGIDVGKEILRRNPGCRIIIASGEWERFKEGYVIRAARFVTKPFDEEEIAEALAEASHMWLGEGVIEAYFENRKLPLRQREIRYILSYDGYVRIYTADRIYRRESSLEKMLELLDERLFVRTDRGTVVNLAYVQQEEGDAFVLAGQKFKIARRRREEVRRAYIDFRLKYRGRMGVWQ